MTKGNGSSTIFLMLNSSLVDNMESLVKQPIVIFHTDGNVYVKTKPKPKNDWGRLVVYPAPKTTIVDTTLQWQIFSNEGRWESLPEMEKDNLTQIVRMFLSSSRHRGRVRGIINNTTLQ